MLGALRDQIQSSQPLPKSNMSVISNRMFDSRFVNSIINQNTLSELNISTLSQKSKLQEYREGSLSVAFAGRPSEEQKSVSKAARDGEEFKQLIDLYIEQDSRQLGNSDSVPALETHLSPHDQPLLAARQGALKGGTLTATASAHELRGLVEGREEAEALRGGNASAGATARKAKRKGGTHTKAEKKTEDMLEEVRQKIQCFDSERRKTLTAKSGLLGIGPQPQPQQPVRQPGKRGGGSQAHSGGTTTPLFGKASPNKPGSRTDRNAAGFALGGARCGTLEEKHPPASAKHAWLNDKKTPFSSKTSPRTGAAAVRPPSKERARGVYEKYQTIKDGYRGKVSGTPGKGGLPEDQASHVR